MPFRLFALFLLCSGLLSAAEQWIRLTTPHFELYTTAGERKGREAILYFEQVRSFFLQASPSKHVPDFPVRIIAFKGEKQYRPYRINDFAVAYYTASQERDYIVMQDIQAEHFPVAIHEYTHLIIQHTGLKVPVWMNEGWADLYSSLRPIGKKAIVGDLLPGRVQTIFTSAWLPLGVLTGVDHKSPLYNERDKAGVFYAESWALMHMLFLDKRYSSHFSQFVDAIGSGKSMSEACTQALGVPMPEVEKDLHAYLKGNQIFAAVFDIKLEKSAEEAVLAEPDGFETGMALADLLATTQKGDQAKAIYDRLAKENPARPEVEESLGYLAWQNGDRDSARGHFSKALQLGTRNALMCFQYGLLTREAGTPEQAIPALRRAVGLKPDYTDARLQLGTSLLNEKDAAGAVAAFRGIKRVTREQAKWFFHSLAYAYLQTGDFANARKNAELAKKWAETPAETEQAFSFLSYLDQREKPVGDSVLQPARQDPLLLAEGKAQLLECTGKSARFTILTAEGPLTFDIPDPKAVILNRSSESEREFACGPQNGYRVVVGYRKPGKADNPSSAGIVRTLEF